MTGASDSPSRALADFVLGLSASDVPPATRAQAGTLVLDAVGSAVLGSATPASRILLAEARSRYRSGPSSVWPAGPALDPAGAALVNAAAAHGFESDDYLPAGKTHLGAVVVPVALALADADADVSGEQLVTAVVAGYEVIARVSVAANGAATRRRGWHVTGLVGPLGAAAVAGRLLGLDGEQLTHALGVAASCSGGTFAFSAEGAMTKPLHAGRAAEAGIVAARLARDGFTGPTHGLDAEDGGLLRAVSDAPEIGRLTDGLGERFALDDVAIKPYPCCGSVHSSIDAVLALRERHGVRDADVDAIEALNAETVLLQCGFAYQGHGGPLEAQMSMQYCVAAALADGEVGTRQFSDERRQDPALIALSQRVACGVDEEIDALYPREFPALVRIRTTRGDVLEERVATPRGMPGRPLSRDEVEAKFRDAGDGVLDERARDALIRATRDLDAVPCAADLVARP